MRKFQGMMAGTMLAGMMAAAPAAAQVVIVQPGAPGTASRVITATDAARVADTRFIQADIDFMQAMIHHHAQATEMAALVAGRTGNPEITAMAGRIAASQEAEMKFMRDWLAARGFQPMGADHMMHMAPMKGMASPAQMAALRAAKGVAFDRMFLELMTAHHAGAIDMVRALLETPGAAYDPVLFQFTGDVVNDQRAEIRRMNTLASQLAGDPRSGLAAGFRNAGEAIMGLTKVASLPKPAGFFDPANPAGYPALKPGKDAKPGDAPRYEPADPNANTEFSARSPLLSFAQTDMAFAGDKLFVGNYHGFNTYRLGAGGVPVQVGSVVCAGGQGDLSVVGNLLIMSVEQNRGRVDCTGAGVEGPVNKDRFRGIRIFDISDVTRPRQVGLVQTCRGSHTHSVVKGPEGDGKILVYVSGTANVRRGEELAGCLDAGPGRDSSYFRIDVVEIPVANPAAARIIDSPAVFMDPRTGRLDGLNKGGKSAPDAQDSAPTDQCHDITVFPSKRLAAGACSGNGIIFDIADPRKPRRIDAVNDPGFAYWHSATFNNDGTKVIFTDEWGGGGAPRCRAQDPRGWGADALYTIVGGKLTRTGTYKLPAAQTEQENCVAHNGSIVPVPGRDVMVQSWYQGGISVFDFTDGANPVEIGYFDRGPIDAKRPSMGGYWSSYYYKGRIYGTEIARGLDVFALKAGPMLSQNEIDAAALADYGAAFNPQTQTPVTWPAVPVVARAYMDQMRRAGMLDAALDARLGSALDAAARLGTRRDRTVAARLTALAAEVGMGDARRSALAGVLTAMAGRLG